MPQSLLDEYCAWSSGSKIELVGGQLIVGDSLTHSRLLLSQILRGWGIEAIVALAGQQLWWKALSQAFGTLEFANLSELDAASVQQWAEQIDFEPELPLHHGDWRWAYSQLRQSLRLAMFNLGSRHEKLGQSLGNGFVNRIGEQGVMPDILFYRGHPRNRLYEYYLDGPADVIVEFIQPLCDRYTRNVKRSLYQVAGVPEYWIVDPSQKQIELLRLIEGCYQPQTPDFSGRYCVSSIPGLTFKPDLIWLAKEDWEYPQEEAWFEVAPDAPRLEKIPLLGEGVDWSRGLLKFPVALESVAIAFDDYIYWCPEAKFEFANGRPEIGGREGIKGLTGMLLMTFGLIEAVKLAHPRDWLAALLQVRARTMDATHKAHWWKLAHQTAAFLHSHYSISRIAVAGDIVASEPLNFWSELVLVVWGLPESSNRYTSPHAIVQQLSQEPRIRLVDASRELTAAQTQLLQAGMVELS